MRNILIKKLIASLIIIILIALLVSYYLQIYPQTYPQTPIKKITAKEAFSIANQSATQWKNDATLYRVATNAIGDDGKSSVWWFWFIPNSDYIKRTNIYCTTYVEELRLDINGNGKVTKEIGRKDLYDLTIISNWSLDSSDIMEILLQNLSMKNWLEKHEGTTLNGFEIYYRYKLGSNTNNIIVNRTIIYLSYRYNGPWPSEGNSYHIYMDPRDGTILDAPWSQNSP